MSTHYPKIVSDTLLSSLLSYQVRLTYSSQVNSPGCFRVAWASKAMSQQTDQGFSWHTRLNDVILSKAALKSVSNHCFPRKWRSRDVMQRRGRLHCWKSNGGRRYTCLCCISRDRDKNSTTLLHYENKADNSHLVTNAPYGALLLIGSLREPCLCYANRKSSLRLRKYISQLDFLLL